MYDPTIGRWLSQDPTGLEPDVNPYRYVGNSPTNATDPSGLQQADPPVKLPPPPEPPPPRPSPRGGSRRPDLDSIPSIYPEQIEYQIKLDAWRRECELIKRAAAGTVTVTIPRSTDGTDGFCFRIEDFKVRNIEIKGIGPGNAPRRVRIVLPFITNETIKEELKKQLEGKKVYQFDSLAPGTVCDEKNKVAYDGKRIIVELKDQRVYPMPGEDWYVTVTGRIELDVGKGSIAPSKKKD